MLRTIRTIMCIACAGIAVLMWRQFAGIDYPGSTTSLMLILVGLVTALWRLEWDVVGRQPAEKRRGPTVGPPEHIHWPEEVRSVLDEPVGRHICVECYDECPAAVVFEINGEEVVWFLRPEDDTSWIRDRAGRVTQLPLDGLPTTEEAPIPRKG